MIRLRPFLAADIPLILRWVGSEPEMLLWAGPTYDWPLTAAQLQCRAADARPPDYVWSVVDDSEVVGHLRLAVTPYRSARLGSVLVSPEARGRGLGRLLVGAALDFAFGELDLHRVGLGVWAHNERAIRVYEKAGFVREGLLRDVALVDGTFWSQYEMGLLASERPT